MRLRLETAMVTLGAALVIAPVGRAADAPPPNTPTAAAARAAPSAPAAGVRASGVKEGFMVIPAVGINSYQGDAGQGAGVGLRIGLLAGSRMSEHWSLNLGVAFDKKNLDAAGASDYAFDLGVSPLIHFPQQKFEILAGPILASFVDKGAAGSGTFAVDTWTFGWTIGANVGAVVRVGPKASVGGLVNFVVRNPLKACISTNGSDNCVSDGLPSAKVLAVTAAAMF